MPRKLRWGTELSKKAHEKSIRILEIECVQPHSGRRGGRDWGWGAHRTLSPMFCESGRACMCTCTTEPLGCTEATTTL